MPSMKHLWQPEDWEGCPPENIEIFVGYGHWAVYGDATEEIEADRAQEVRNFLFRDGSCHETSGVNARIHRGGQTRLHVEACDGNFDAVRNLVENCNASLTIRDNAGLTAEQACFYMGRTEIANYLKHRRLGL